MHIKKLNSSFSLLTGEKYEINHIYEQLKTEIPNANFDYLVKIGRKSRYTYHSQKASDNSLLIKNGHLSLPFLKNLVHIEMNNENIDLLQNTHLPFPPYDYQLDAANKCINEKIALKLMATGSGKSLTISLLLNYFVSQNLKGCLIVPNINLLKQFQSDLKAYNMQNVLDKVSVVGGGEKFDLDAFKDKNIILTTWQSLVNIDTKMIQSLNFVICDEVHRFSSKCTSDLVLSTINAEYKFGFTGTLPDSQEQKMILIGLFGMPERIITSNDLIENGQGTQIHINVIEIKHKEDISEEIYKVENYVDKVKILANYQPRNHLITKLATNLSNKNEGCTLILYTLIEHGEQLYQSLTGQLPGSLQDQINCNTFFMNGSVKAKDRETIRNLVEANKNSILVANYSLLSTGVNIKSLKNIIFASPMKSGTTITQSIGRAIRLSEGKTQGVVYDLVDKLNGTRIFVNSFDKRKKLYQKDQFPFTKRQVEL